MGKSCVLETLPNKERKLLTLKGLKFNSFAESKTLPISTPTRINLYNNYNYYYDTFEAYNLAQNKSLSSIYESWFSII